MQSPDLLSFCRVDMRTRFRTSRRPDIWTFSPRIQRARTWPTPTEKRGGSRIRTVITWRPIHVRTETLNTGPSDIRVADSGYKNSDVCSFFRPGVFYIIKINELA
jgi:hypothetical protein